MLLERVCDGDRSDARQKRAVDLRKRQLAMTRQEAVHSAAAGSVGQFGGTGSKIERVMQPRAP